MRTLEAQRQTKAASAAAAFRRKVRGPRKVSARSRRRREAWEYDLAQRQAYQRATARTDAEREALDRAYEAEVSAGPDFEHYRHDSTFMEPPRHDLAAQMRMQILRSFDAIRTWTYEVRGPRGQAVSRNYRDVLDLLLRYAMKPAGQVYPSLKHIGDRCRVCVRTVQNALDWLQTWGFIDRYHRIVRVPSRLGQRVRQTSNAYRVGLEALKGAAAAAFHWLTDGNHCRERASAPSYSVMGGGYPQGTQEGFQGGGGAL